MSYREDDVSKTGESQISKVNKKLPGYMAPTIVKINKK
jgi:hypothetical protein